MTRKRIVLATIGSLGDLHPYMALALGLSARGHDVVLAASEYYRSRIEAAGIRFAPMRPDPPLDQDDIYKRILDPKSGTEFTFRHLIIDAVADTYEDLARIATQPRCDLLISSPTVFAARLVAEKFGIRWASSILAPLSMFSAYEPPVVHGIPAALSRGPAFLRPWWGRRVLAVARDNVRSWMQTLVHLREQLQLPATTRDPLFTDQHAPDLSLLLFSQVFAGPQPDWPSQTRQCGFAFYDAEEDGSSTLEPELEAFLSAGPPPIVFTLGSTAVHDAAAFFAESAAAALLVGRRALLLAGNAPENRIGLPRPLPESVGVFSYAPYSAVFPRAVAVVHQGGIGTTAQVLRAGVPSIVVPFSFDQPDNAARLAAMRAGYTIRRSAYRARRVARVLRRLLANESMSLQTRALAGKIAAEDGVAHACTLLEKVFC